MSGAIDVPGQFPNSYMAKAVRAGQSQFRSVQTAAVGTLLATSEQPPKEPADDTRKLQSQHLLR